MDKHDEFNISYQHLSKVGGKDANLFRQEKFQRLNQIDRIGVTHYSRIVHFQSRLTQIQNREPIGGKNRAQTPSHAAGYYVTFDNFETHRIPHWGRRTYIVFRSNHNTLPETHSQLETYTRKALIVRRF